MKKGDIVRVVMADHDEDYFVGHTEDYGFLWKLVEDDSEEGGWYCMSVADGCNTAFWCYDEIEELG